jgi:DNA-binding NtrC family response regulator
MMAMGDVIDVADLPPAVQYAGDGFRQPPVVAGGTASGLPAPNGGANGLSLEEHERQLLDQALTQAGGNQSKAARQLRIGRDALRYKMKKYGLL